ncbi:hypothetical protein [Natronosalvus halobius]|uniref:hypothetical protein n=1 Tax=Natronosalvus halobius TaxID=2953746 RepID=UPI00209E2437|nr:hypothetical protein [Natronosalvus halobius]USZ73234.1 hypothetical protein NGM15_08040 [Natronosalvus halobius]
MEPVELLGNFGFPVVAFLLMFRLYREERNERREERSNWLEAIKAHTGVLRDMRHDVRSVATDGGEDEHDGGLNE